ncbi:MAG TPA: hypothetical protein VKM72_25025 [Thermoanaerobaculia bacterium]|nr:hypothetical protein [Thermoanaerobaculia bacterium]
MAQSRSRETWCAVLLFLCLAASAAAQEGEGEQAEQAESSGEAESLRPRFHFSLEGKANYRDSEENRFQVPFDFDPSPNSVVRGFEETVNSGSHFEVSALTLLLDASWGDGLAAHGKIDFIDLYDRNPTSTDKKADVDEAWVRFGVEPEPATLAPRTGVYLKIGKMPKLERQDDRHLESYGLVSTAFNRFEDSGAELGVSLGRHVYAKLSATSGNPVFMRDPNALAGDNGTPDRSTLDANPDLKSGIVILYDAEVEDLDVDGDLELGGGLGVRFADEAGRNGVDVLVWSYQRTLADRVELEGTFYGGDLDLLNGPEGHFEDVSLAIRGDKKEEVGGNVWLYWGGLSLFAQYVDQEIAGLPRTGLEAEVAWRFDLPLWIAVGDRQLFPWIAPAVRWSRLDNDFRNPRGGTPAPSLTWDWDKIDAGVRLGIFQGIDLTLEYADNKFILGNGAERENNEFLATLRWRS